MRKYLPTFLALAIVLGWASAAHAAGSSMPWEAPLQAILQSIEGPLAARSNCGR